MNLPAQFTQTIINVYMKTYISINEYENENEYILYIIHTH